MESAKPTAPILEAIDVKVTSHWSQLIEINGVNWKVGPGESWVVGGRHGSGKTDLLMTMAGLHQPAGGKVRLFGTDTAQLTETDLLKQRTRVGFVFKDGGRMFNELTVAENIALPLCYHRNWRLEEARAAVKEILDWTDLSSLAQDKAQMLGTGWRQRVGLARALALKPQILFLDEPTSGLEADHHQWAQAFLAGLAKKQIAVISSTYDFAPWQGGRHNYVVIKDKQWQVLGERPQAPQSDFQTEFIKR